MTSLPISNARSALAELRFMARPAAIFLVAASLCTGVGAAADWPGHAGATDTNFSPLAQIDRDNVARLEQTWVWRNREAAAELGGGLRAVPILVSEPQAALVFCTPLGVVVALDPASGSERWRFDPKVGRDGAGTLSHCEGVSQWRDPDAPPDDACATRIFLATDDRRLYALDARDGKSCTGFGDLGLVRLMPLIRAAHPDADVETVHLSMPPAVVGDIVVLGSRADVADTPAATPPAAVRAFDARNGKLRWTWTPLADGPAAIHGVSVPGWISTDADRGLLFMATSAPVPKFFGGARPGDNRYASSTVALHSATGKLAWYFQVVHHDVWGYGAGAPPLPIDIRRGRKNIAAVVQLSGTGHVFVFGRETGKPLFDVSEQPAPGDGVAGDALSPTQPVPRKPPALAPTGVVPDDAFGFSFYDEGVCRETLASMRSGPLFTPPSTRGTVMLPAARDDPGSAAYDASRNLLIAVVASVPGAVRLVPAPASSKPAGEGAGDAPDADPAVSWRAEHDVSVVSSPFGAPCVAPPWNRLVAVDLAAGDIRWSVALGTPPGLPQPPLGGPLGAPGRGGPMVTAGGLVFVAATADATIRAFDVENGRPAWQHALPASGAATPMSYTVAGRQFVVVATGIDNDKGKDEDNGGALVAFALAE